MRDYEELMRKSLPEHLLNKEDYRVILQLIFDAAKLSFEQIDYLRFIYAVDSADPVYLPRLADTLKFNFPVGQGFTINHLRLFVKYYMEIHKQRGTMESIKKMVRLIRVTEEDICAGSFPDYTGVKVERLGAGILKITYSSLSSGDLQWAYELLKKVVPAGHIYQVANNTDAYPAVI